MASISRRRNREGSASWDATARIVGYPTACKTFPTKLEAELWSVRLWREQLGTLRLIDVTPQIVAVHRDALLGATPGE